MRSRTRRYLPLFAAVTIWISIVSATRAADFTALIQEGQKMIQTNHTMTLVWWIPEEFWRASALQNRELTPARVEDVVDVFRPYTLVAVVKSKMGPFGGTTYESASALRESVTILGKDGVRYRPLSEGDVNADTKNFLKMMQPMFASMLGPLGENFHIFVFPAKDKKGKRIANAKEEGSLRVDVSDLVFRWRLPLSSALPLKVCSKCNETLSGAFKFCPYDATPLK